MSNFSTSEDNSELHADPWGAAHPEEHDPADAGTKAASLEWMHRGVQNLTATLF